MFESVRMSKRCRKLLNKCSNQDAVVGILCQMRTLSSAMYEMEMHEQHFTPLYTHYYKTWKVLDRALYKILKLGEPKYC